MPNQEGFAKGFATVDYPGVDDGVPLLSSFYFRFQKKGSPKLIDHHINSIRVLPAGNSVDLSPHADLGPSQVEPGKVDITFADRKPTSSDDAYFFKLAHLNLPVGKARRFQFRDVGCVGECTQVLPHPPGHTLPGVEPVFVLCGFKVFFTGNRDHHLDALSVYVEDGKLTVEFNDDDDDATFGYLVDYALVSPIGLNIQQGESRGVSKGGNSVTLPPGPKAIRGFRFDLKKGDHEIREIGVILNDDRLEIYNSDNEANDQYNWFVQWATITPMVVEQ
jgi:hypothetical protein